MNLKGTHLGDQLLYRLVRFAFFRLRRHAQLDAIVADAVDAFALGRRARLNVAGKRDGAGRRCLAAFGGDEPDCGAHCRGGRLVEAARRWREGAPPARQNSPPQLQGSLSPQSIPPQAKASPCRGLLKLCKFDIHVRKIALPFSFFFLKKKSQDIVPDYSSPQFCLRLRYPLY